MYFFPSGKFVINSELENKIKNLPIVSNFYVVFKNRKLVFDYIYIYFFFKWNQTLISTCKSGAMVPRPSQKSFDGSKR